MINVNIFGDMTREQIRDFARDRRYCQLVSRDGKDYGHASEEFMHDRKGQGVRYHRAVRLVIWAPNSREMLFRWTGSGWDSAVGGHVYYKELNAEALHRLINEQIRIEEPEMSIKSVISRTNSLFSIPACVATGMELVDVYSMTLRHGEILESGKPILSVYPRDLEKKILLGEIETSNTLSMLLEKLNGKYIF